MDPNKDPHVYRTRYALEPEAGAFSARDCREVGGGCDALYVASLIFPEDGSLSVMSFGFDGRADGADLEPTDKFKVFMSLASELATALPEGSWNQRIAHATMESVRISIQRMKDGEFEIIEEDDDEDYI